MRPIIKPASFHPINWCTLRALKIMFGLTASIFLLSCGNSDDSTTKSSTTSSGQPAVSGEKNDGALQPSTLPSGTLDTKGISIFAGTGGPGFGGDGGPAAAAEMYGPTGLAIDTNGNIYIATDNRIRKVDSKTGVITTVAGTGSPGFGGDGKPAIDAKFKAPEAIAIDNSNNIYVADRNNGRIRKIDSATGIVTTIAGGGIPKRVGGVLDPGDGGKATDAWFKESVGVAVDGLGNLYFLADNRVRKIDSDGIISTIGGTGIKDITGDGGPAIEATMADPTGITVDAEGKSVYIADTGNHRIRHINLATGIITTLAGQGKVALGTAIDPLKSAAGSREGGGGAGFEGDGGQAVDSKVAMPKGVALGPDGNLYIADTGNDRIRKIDLSSGIISSVVDGGAMRGDKMEAGFIGSGDIEVTFKHFSPPRALAIDQSGNFYIADVRENKVVKYTP